MSKIRNLEHLRADSPTTVDFNVSFRRSELLAPLVNRLLGIGAVSSAVAMVLAACGPRPSEQPPSQPSPAETTIAGARPKDTAVITLTVPPTDTPIPTETPSPKNEGPTYKDVKEGIYKELSESTDKDGIKTVRALDSEKGILIRFKQLIPGDDSSITYLNSYNCVDGKNRGCIGYEVVSEENFLDPNKTYIPDLRVGIVEIDGVTGKGKVVKELKDDDRLVDIVVPKGYLIRPDATALADVDGEVKLVSSKEYDIKFWIGGKAPETISQINPEQFSVMAESGEVLEVPKIAGLRQEKRLINGREVVVYLAKEGNIYGYTKDSVVGLFNPEVYMLGPDLKKKATGSVALSAKAIQYFEAQTKKWPLPFDVSEIEKGSKVYIQYVTSLTYGRERAALYMPVGTKLVNFSADRKYATNVNVLPQRPGTLVNVSKPELFKETGNSYYLGVQLAEDKELNNAPVQFGDAITSILSNSSPTLIYINSKGKFYPEVLPEVNVVLLFLNPLDPSGWRGFTLNDTIFIGSCPVTMVTNRSPFLSP